MLPNCLFIERNPNRKDVVELHCSCPEKTAILRRWWANV